MLKVVELVMAGVSNQTKGIGYELSVPPKKIHRSHNR